MHKENLSHYAKGGTISEAWAAFEAHWRQTISSTCAWVKVWRIQALTQRGHNWTVKYSIKDAAVTQPINPDLAFELLHNNLVGHTLPNAWFIINPDRVEDIVIVEPE